MTPTTTTTSPTEPRSAPRSKTKRERLDASGRRAKPPAFKRRRMLRVKDSKTGQITWSHRPKVATPPLVHNVPSGRLSTTPNTANAPSTEPYGLGTRALAAIRKRADG